MNPLMQIGLTNAVAATGLAMLAIMVCKVCRRPALCHALWLLVFLKLLAPPLVLIPIVLPSSPQEETATASPGEVPLQSALTELDLRQGEAERSSLYVEAWTGPVGQPELPGVAEAPLAPPLLSPLAPEPPYAWVPPAEEEPAWSMPEVPWLTLLGSIWLTGSVSWF